MERATEVFAALYLLGIGLSHLLRPHTWVEAFIRLRGQGRAAMFAEGLLSLGFGAFVVSFHNVWSGPAMVLTIVGWGQVLKGIVRLVAPGASLRAYGRIAPERAWEFRVAGVFALLLGGLFAYVAMGR